MNISEIKKLKVGKIIENANMMEYTTYKLNGTLKAVIFPNDVDSLKVLLIYLKENNVKYKIVGGGSNLIFNDEYYDGVVIKLDKFNELKITDDIVNVGSGYNLVKLSLKTARMGLSGLEFASGIPGTIGGATFNNSGAYNSDMSKVIISVTVLDNELNLKTLKNEEINYSYRNSLFKEKPNFIILNVNLKLNFGDKDEILEVINNRRERRLESQPLEFPSAGSVFRNPIDNYAGKLIEESGFKGLAIGGAMVSMKHANFIVTTNSVVGRDVVDLITEIKDKVKEKYDIDLILEQEIVK